MADAFTSETYNALCRDAEGYLARGLAEQARELLLKATSLIGTRARARSLLADSCMQLGLWGEAKSQLEALATLEVDNIYTHFRLGQVLEETCEYELARDNFKVVLDMNPDHHGARVSLARLEKITDKPSAAKKTPVAEGQQIFADSDEEDGIFASESSGGIDDLLNTIGMGEKKDVPGVEDLLSSIGMSGEEKKKEEKPQVDFNSIFGTSPEDEEPGNQSPLSSVFTQEESDKGKPDSESLSAVFGSSEPAEEQKEEPAVEEKQAEEPSADLDAIFGGSEPAEEQKEEPAVEEKQAEEPSADLDAIFNGGGEPAEEPEKESVTAEEKPAEEASADLSSIFEGGEPSEEQKEEPAAVEKEEAAEEPVAEEKPEEEVSADLSSIFGGDEPAEEQKEEPAAVEKEEAAGRKTGYQRNISRKTEDGSSLCRFRRHGSESQPEKLHLCHGRQSQFCRCKKKRHSSIESVGSGL